MLYTTFFYLFRQGLVGSALERHAAGVEGCYFCTAAREESACSMSQAKARQPADVCSALLVLAGWESCLLAGLDRHRIGSVLVLRPTVPACDSIKLERLSYPIQGLTAQRQISRYALQPQHFTVDLAA